LRYITLSLVNWLRNEESSNFKVQKISAEKVYFTILRGYGLNFPTVFGLAVAWSLDERPTDRYALTVASPKKREDLNHCL